MEFIDTKSILQYAKYGNRWFGIDYNMNLYRGCSHGCIYCDSRSNCYGINDFDVVKAKKDCIKILEKELIFKRKKGVIGIGAMSDTYNPLEEKYNITRQALEVIKKYKFGISIDNKSDLITRDIDILKSIDKNCKSIFKLTITTADDNLAKIIEPNVCNSTRRFEAVSKLSDAGLYTGILLTPMLPFITDTEENIKQIIYKAHLSGAKFIFSMGGVTLRENQRQYYYNKLDINFPKIKEKYIKTYGNNYLCNTQNNIISKVFVNECKKYDIKYKMEDIVNGYKQNNICQEQLDFLN